MGTLLDLIKQNPWENTAIISFIIMIIGGTIWLVTTLRIPYPPPEEKGKRTLLNIVSGIGFFPFVIALVIFVVSIMGLITKSSS